MAMINHLLELGLRPHFGECLILLCEKQPSECSDYWEILWFFVERGMDVHYIRYPKGQSYFRFVSKYRDLGTALHDAVRVGNVRAVRLLLGEGADPSIRTTRRNMTCLDVAEEFGNAEIINLPWKLEEESIQTVLDWILLCGSTLGGPQISSTVAFDNYDVCSVLTVK